MKNFDFESKKNLIIIALVCLLFAIFIMKAFEFIPKEDSVESSQNLTNVEQIAEETTSEDFTEEELDEETESDTEEQDIAEEETVESVEDVSDNELTIEEEKNSLEPLETISEAGKEPISYVSELFLDAENSIKQKKYEKSKQLYNTIISSNSTIEEKAKANEGLAHVFAVEGEYGNALSYAQRACELSSTPSRELTLARIYEKLDEPELAKQHMDKVLKKDFE